MRLLNAKTLELTQFVGEIPPYAILSHTWGAEEVTFQDITSPERDKKKGFAKILGCCRQALIDTLEWVWIDTCCIDKTSSAELSEAINSMYAWYRDSQFCYVYLEDVISSPPAFCESEFRRARWFTRGWCLQELIAPRTLEFFNTHWRDIGSKFSLRDPLHSATTIPKAVLLGQSRALEECSVAQKMSWASERHTTRIEDEAYCLLGIFGVNMPMLYGEGYRAFHRLQQEIIRQTEDHSFLLWATISDFGEPGPESRDAGHPVLARRPAYFHPGGAEEAHGHLLRYQDIRRGWPAPSTVLVPHPHSKPAEITSRGLRILLPQGEVLSKARSRSISVPREHLLWTGFTYHDRLICIRLVRDGTPGLERYFRSCSGGAQLRLVAPELVRTFQHREIYLAMTMPVAARPVPVGIPDIWGFEEVADMQIMLSSPDNTAISLGMGTPRLSLQLVSKSPEEPRATGRLTQLWCAKIDDLLDEKFWYEGDYMPVSLTCLIDLGRNGAQQDIQVTTHLSIEERCTCVIDRVAAEGEPVIPPEPDPSASDRSQYALWNGDVALATVKCITGRDWHRSFILRVAVLPGRRT
jgi:hypothetical protein